MKTSSSGLKGHDSTAQGNALGTQGLGSFKPFYE